MTRRRLHISMPMETVLRIFNDEKIHFRLIRNDPNSTLATRLVYGSILLRLYFDVLLIKLNILLSFKFKRNKNTKPQLKNLCLFADSLPITWGKIIKTSAADYEDRINELWASGNKSLAKWNQKLAWICGLSNLGLYLWLKAWKPVSTVFRRLL